VTEPERKRRGPIGWLAARTWRFCVAVAVMLYILSLPTATWLDYHDWVPPGSILRYGFAVYVLPASLVYSIASPPISDWIEWYSMILVNPDDYFIVP